MNVQFIHEDKKPAYAVLPIAEYEALVRAAEDAEDVRAYDEGMAAIEAGEEMVPGEMVERMIAGESPVKVWREHRGLTQTQLAEKAGLSQAALSNIEAGSRPGVDAAVLISKALGLDVDDLF